MNRGTTVDARVSQKAVWGGELGRPAGLLTILALTLSVAGCGDLTTQGTGSSYLIITSLQAASGAEPGTLSSTLNSDVITIVDDAPTIFNDLGQVTLSLQMKDPDERDRTDLGHFITINRYRVRYIRSDGRNTPGVDVPYGFDGALTGTVTDTDFTSWIRARAAHREKRSSTAGAGGQPGHHLDHRRNHLLRARPDRP